MSPVRRRRPEGRGLSARPTRMLARRPRSVRRLCTRLPPPCVTASAAPTTSSGLLVCSYRRADCTGAVGQRHGAGSRAHRPSQRRFVLSLARGRGAGHRGAVPGDPVHPELRPVGVAGLGPRDHPFRPAYGRRALVEAAADAVHGSVRAVRQGAAGPVARDRTSRRRDGGGDGVQGRLAHNPRHRLGDRGRDTGARLDGADRAGPRGPDRRGQPHQFGRLRVRQRARLLGGARRRRSG